MHKLYHFTIANTRFTAPLTRRGKFAPVYLYNLCHQIIQSQTWYPLNIGLIRLESEGVAGSIPDGYPCFHLEFLLVSNSSQLDEAYTNEIKYDIHPE